jgi:hypothetical protein
MCMPACLFCRHKESFDFVLYLAIRCSLFEDLNSHDMTSQDKHERYHFDCNLNRQCTSSCKSNNGEGSKEYETMK